jgi:antitoxin CptB
MLELDLMLQPFVENVYPGLNEEDQHDYQQLLEQQDADLFTWLLSHQTPKEPNLQRIVKIVRENSRKNTT